MFFLYTLCYYVMCVCVAPVNNMNKIQIQYNVLQIFFDSSDY